MENMKPLLEVKNLKKNLKSRDVSNERLVKFSEPSVPAKL